MNRNSSAAEPHLKVITRPSLYTTEVSPSADKPASILASLEPESAERKVNRMWLLAALLGLLVVGVSYWAYVNLMFQQPILVPAWIETALNISKAPIPVAGENDQAGIAKQEKPIEIATEETRPATIVTEPAAPVSVSSAIVEASTAKVDPADKVAKLEPDAGMKKNTELQPALATAIAQKPVISQKPEATESAAHKTTATPKLKDKTADTRHTRKPVKTQAARNAKDEDVDLIAALLNRVSRQDTGAKDAKLKKTGVTTTQTANATSVKRQNKSDPNRDIVTRADGDTTEALLKRCKALGFFEGELCRVRICTSLWGKDPACPAPEQAALPNSN